MSKIDNAAIKSAALQLAQAEANVQETCNQHSNAQAALDRIDSRMDALREKRNGIVTAGRQEPKNPQHALDLAVTDADLEDLEQERTKAQDAVDAARKRQEAAKSACATAQRQLQRAEDEAAGQALLEHLNQLDALMLATVDQLSEVNKRLGITRPTWGPSYDLRGKLRIIQAALGTL